MPWSRFGQRVFQIGANPFVPTLPASVGVNKSQKSANIIGVLLVQVAVIGDNRVSRITAIIISVFKTFITAMHACTIVLKGHEFTQQAAIITQPVGEAARGGIKQYQIGI